MGKSRKNRTKSITLWITPHVKNKILDTFKYTLGIELGQEYYDRDFIWRIPVAQNYLVGQPFLSAHLKRRTNTLDDWIRPRPKITPAPRNESEAKWDIGNQKEFFLHWTVLADGVGYHHSDKDPNDFIYNEDKIILAQPSQLVSVHFVHSRNISIISTSLGRRMWYITKEGIELVETNFPAGKELPFHFNLRIT